MDITIRQAEPGDVDRITATLAANATDRALFGRSPTDVTRHLGDFIVAEDGDHDLVGCGAVHSHREDCVEILSVAVPPSLQGQGIGGKLMREAVRRACSRPTCQLWLATAKPEYFARFGFVPFSRFALPGGVLLAKLRQVFEQPAARWLPAILARFTFMEYRRQQHVVEEELRAKPE
jgi:amino-acid N-acetyltransferase